MGQCSAYYWRRVRQKLCELSEQGSSRAYLVCQPTSLGCLHMYVDATRTGSRMIRSIVCCDISRMEDALLGLIYPCLDYCTMFPIVSPSSPSSSNRPLPSVPYRCSSHTPPIFTIVGITRSQVSRPNPYHSAPCSSPAWFACGCDISLERRGRSNLKSNNTTTHVPIDREQLCC